MQHGSPVMPSDRALPQGSHPRAQHRARPQQAQEEAGAGHTAGAPPGAPGGSLGAAGRLAVPAVPAALEQLCASPLAKTKSKKSLRGFKVKRQKG